MKHLLFSGGSQPCEAVAPDRGVSSDVHGHPHGIWRKPATDISFTILKNKLYSCLQIFFGFCNGFTLSIGARYLQADCPEATLWSRFNHSGQLSSHQFSPNSRSIHFRREDAGQQSGVIASPHLRRLPPLKPPIPRYAKQQPVCDATAVRPRRRNLPLQPPADRRPLTDQIRSPTAAQKPSATWLS